MADEIRIELTPRQSLAFRLLTNPEDEAVLYGGGKGGGKSMLFCLWLDHWCTHLVEFFDLKKPTKTPLPVGFVGRKQGVDFRMTTLETFKRTIPDDHYRIADDGREIIFFERLKVYCGGLDDKKRINKFNSAEFAFLAIDQAEETERPDVDVLQATLRLKYKGKTPPYKELYTANPGDCWLKEDFINQKVPHKHFVPALHSDNKHLPASYEARLISSFKYNQALLDAYLKGDWSALKAANALVSSAQLDALKGVHRIHKEVKGIVVCDPSLGGDECVIVAMKNYKEIERLILHERDQMKIAGHMRILGVKHGIPNYAADTTGGLGTAILDRIKELKDEANEVSGKLIYINSAEGSSNPDAYANLRMEVSWYFMERVMDLHIPYIEDEETRRQLLALKFKVINSNGLTIMLPKDQIKEKLGCSPDRAETLIMGVWAQDKTEPIKPRDSWRDSGGHTREIGGGATSAMAA